jgi:hypothetical protein
MEREVASINQVPIPLSLTEKVMKKLLSYWFLIPLALLLGFAPFFPQPHIVEKLGMLAAGTLKKPVDVLHLFWHAWPFVLLAYRVFRDIGRERCVRGEH